ncbi:MAG: ribonuclease Z [archaeon]
MLTVVFLGTSGSVPTVNRSLPSVAIKYNSELLMFDCGEGTQRQMTLARLGLSKKMKILVSHMHGDHVLGLPGVLQSMALMGRTKELDIYGPRGIGDFLTCIQETVRYGLTFPVKIHEVNRGRIVDEPSYEIRATKADHVMTCLAYAFVEKPRPGRFDTAAAKRLKIPEGPLWKRLQFGQTIRTGGRRIRPQQVVGPSRPGIKVTYATDTRPSKMVMALAQASDLLIHDASFDSSLEEKATLDGHSTAAQAASLAKRAKVKRLALTHISARYRDSSILLREARKIFRKSFIAQDLMTTEL